MALGASAQQLAFTHPIPSTQLLGTTVGTLTLQVDDGGGNIISNSSATIVVGITGPDGFSEAETNSATGGAAIFDFGNTALTNSGLYSIAATSRGLSPAFQDIGVEVALMPPQGTIFTGAWVNPPVTNGPQSLPDLEQSCGRTLALSLQYYLWADSAFSSVKNFTDLLAGDATNNRIPVISWQPDVLTNIINGSDDGVITNAARAIAGYQGPVLVRWFWEMNLLNSRGLNALSYPTNGTNPTASQVASAQANFVAAWQRIRRLFDACGAFNVVWLWNPGGGNDSAPGQSSGGYTDGFYPGDAYVDWVGVDAYNRQNDSFADTYSIDPGYNYAAMAAHDKPLLIGETGAYYTNEAHQITFFDSAVGSLQTNFPVYLGLTYFDAAGNFDWSLTTAGETNGLTEYSNMVNAPYLSAMWIHPLSYSQYHPFSARVHMAPAVTTMAAGSSLGVGVSVGGLSSVTPTGKVDIYDGTNKAAEVQLAGGSTNYCQVQTNITLTSVGNHTLVAVYSGDANNAAGQSWPAEVTVVPLPVFDSIRAVGNTLTLTWRTASNEDYQIQFSTNLRHA
ncbi:MAG TPA: Ig-like domain repeat protein, partial [Verrucomicrobiae bacterium]